MVVTFRRKQRMVLLYPIGIHLHVLSKASYELNDLCHDTDSHFMCVYKIPVEKEVLQTSAGLFCVHCFAIVWPTGLVGAPANRKHSAGNPALNQGWETCILLVPCS